MTDNPLRTPGPGWFYFDRPLSDRVMKMAIPIVTGMAVRTLSGVIDTAMIGRLNTAALAAVGQAAVLFWTVHGSISALETATQTMVSRRFGEKQFAACGKVLDNSLFLSALFGIVFTAAGVFVAGDIIRLAAVDAEVIRYGTDYLTICLSGLAFLTLVFSFRGFFTGIGLTRVYFAMAGVSIVVNVFFNYVLIFGKLGFPRLEVRGAAIGTVISFAATFLFSIVFASVIRRRPEFRHFDFFRPGNLDRNIMKRLIVLASPVALKVFCVMTGFSIFVAIVQRIGVTEAAIVQLVINIQSVAFLPGFGFGVAAAALIGQSLGQNLPDLAERYGWESLKIGATFMGIMGVSFILFPEMILRIFTDQESVIQNGVIALRIVGVVQVFDASGMILGSALEGAGNTRWPMVVETAVIYLVLVPSTYVLALALGLGGVGAWLSFAGYMVVYGIATFFKFRQGSWKHIQV